MAGVATWLAAVVGARVPTRTTAAGDSRPTTDGRCAHRHRGIPRTTMQTLHKRDHDAIRPYSAPIFIVGCGRSGTTVVYESVCRHPELAWISNYTNRWPKAPQLAAISRIAPLLQGPALRFADARLAPRPGEGHRAWDVICTAGTARRNGPLMERDVTEVDRRRAEALVRAHVCFQGARRFVNKNTRNSRRIRYLAELFPDAYFLHVMRDPRAVVASLLKVGFWPELPLWWAEDKTPRQMEADGTPSEAVAAQHWAASVHRILSDKETLDSGRYLEVQYEDFVADPARALAAIFSFANVSPYSACRLPAIRSRNDKYRTQLDAGQIRVVESIVSPVAGRIGYALA